MKKTRLSDIFNTDSIRNRKRILDRFEINKKEKRLFLDAVEEIENNEGGSGDKVVLEEKDCNFYDYDGTLLYSYTKEEALTLKELPPLPINERFIYEDWNYTIEDIISEEGDCNIGVTCYTADDQTHLFIKTLKNDEKITLNFCISKFNPLTIIDFGDGVIENYNDFSLDAYQSAWMKIEHIFKTKGDYEIKINTESFGFGNIATNVNENFCISEGLYYPIKEINIGRQCYNVAATIGNIIKINIHNSINLKRFCGGARIKFLTLPRGITSLAYQYLYFSNPINMSLPATLTSIGDSNFSSNPLTISLKYPKSITSFTGFSKFGNTQNKNYSIDIYNILVKQDYIFKNATFKTCFNYNIYIKSATFIDCKNIPTFYNCINLKIIKIISDFVPTLDTTININDLKIVVSDVIYDEIIVATNWANMTDKIIKASEYEENQQ